VSAMRNAPRPGLWSGDAAEGREEFETMCYRSRTVPASWRFQSVPRQAMTGRAQNRSRPGIRSAHD